MSTGKLLLFCCLTWIYVEKLGSEEALQQLVFPLPPSWHMVTVGGPPGSGPVKCPTQTVWGYQNPSHFRKQKQLLKATY